MKKMVLLSIYFLIPSFLFPLSLKSLIPDIKEWKLVENPKLFSPENLYEHINGAAEAYLSFGFKELLVAYFENNTSSLTLEIYDMGNPNNSFGIYSIERSPDYNFIEIGTHGYTDGENLFFIVGSLYIKIFCSECGKNSISELTDFAEKIVEKVKDKGKLPDILRYFPQKGLIQNSEKFFPKNFLGIEFLRNGYQADYFDEDKKFSLFIIEEADERKAENTFEMFKSYLKNRKKPEDIDFGFSMGMIFEDRVHKKMAIVRKRRFILGYLGDGGSEKIKNYLFECIKRTEVKNEN